MNSTLFEGTVRHRRTAPVPHSFRYRVFMVYADLAELDQVFAERWLWSTHRPALFQLRRKDHYGDPAVPLDESIRDLVARETGERPVGRIALLTHLRHFGYCFNPVSFYYCYSQDGVHLDNLVLEVSNTPWHERHMYVLDLRDSNRVRHVDQRFSKVFHVSPFMDMDMTYRCRAHVPGDTLSMHLENWSGVEKRFDATLTMRRLPITGRSLAYAALRYPLMPFRVSTAIYWQALKLWRKGTPYYPHPSQQKAEPHE